MSSAADSLAAGAATAGAAGGAAIGVDSVMEAAEDNKVIKLLNLVLLQAIRSRVDVPLIAAGGIWDRHDLEYALAQGADGVQMASRFVCTEECDAAPEFKQRYIECKQEDIGLIMSPAGLPGRAILTNKEQIRQHDLDFDVACQMGCLKKCSYKETGERFCIVSSLDRAQRGDVETGLVFCGTNAWKADRITTVQAIFYELFGEVPQGLVQAA